MITLTLPWPPKELSPNARLHWRVVAKAKKALADYKKAIGRPEGLAELSVYYCEEAFTFLG